MSEIAAGIIELESSGPRPTPENPDWLFEVEQQDAGELGLLLIKLTVTQANVEEPIEVVLHRFMPDPDYDPLAEEQPE